MRTVEARAAAFDLSGHILLAFGATRDSSGAATGMGLAAFTADGDRLWSALAGEAIWQVETAGGYAYVSTPETVFPSRTRVIDLATGALLRTVRRGLPTFVSDDVKP